jgi:pimeloyl-ACP methyl ester carboxylesterase
VSQSRSAEIPAGEARLTSDLTVPDDASGIIVFAHGSGSGRDSPRNRAIARMLQESGMATLLLDLLTPGEAAEDAATGRLRFDVELLGSRVAAAVDRLADDPVLGGLPTGCFGASTGAAAALIAAAARPERIAAIVSRGGRPDLAGDALGAVRAPTLLIVGGEDVEVLRLNRRAAEAIRCPVALEIVPGAGHLFEEPGAMERVAALTQGWFEAQLRPAA